MSKGGGENHSQFVVRNAARGGHEMRQAIGPRVKPNAGLAFEHRGRFGCARRFFPGKEGGSKELARMTNRQKRTSRSALAAAVFLGVAVPMRTNASRISRKPPGSFAHKKFMQLLVKASSSSSSRSASSSGATASTRRRPPRARRRTFPPPCGAAAAARRPQMTRRRRRRTRRSSRREAPMGPTSLRAGARPTTAPWTSG